MAPPRWSAELGPSSSRATGRLHGVRLAFTWCSEQRAGYAGPTGRVGASQQRNGCERPGDCVWRRTWPWTSGRCCGNTDCGWVGHRSNWRSGQGFRRTRSACSRPGGARPGSRRPPASRRRWAWTRPPVSKCSRRPPGVPPGRPPLRPRLRFPAAAAFPRPNPSVPPSAINSLVTHVCSPAGPRNSVNCSRWQGRCPGTATPGWWSSRRSTGWPGSANPPWRSMLRTGCPRPSPTGSCSSTCTVTPPGWRHGPSVTHWRGCCTPSGYRRSASPRTWARVPRSTVTGWPAPEP